MIEKRFRVTIGDKNNVRFVDSVDNRQLIAISFKEYKDAVDCRDALLYQCDLMNKLYEENEQLKQSQTSMLRELLIYRRIANCSNCKHQNYDWFEDGDEFEICEKGNSNQQIEYHICKEWEKF